MHAPHFAEYATRLGYELAERADVLLICDRVNAAQELDDDLRRTAPANVALLEFDSVGRKNRAISLARIALRVALFQPDVLIMQEQIDTLTAWVARLVGKFVPILLTVHDPEPHSGVDADYVRRNAHNRRDIRAAARAYHVHGRFCWRQLAGQVDAAKPIVETMHGVILTPTKGATPRKAEPGRILMFGRMQAYKGLETLLDAADLLDARKLNFTLVVAGRGPELDRLAPRLTDRANIEIVRTFLSPTEASDQFQRAAIVVTPYINATQSGVVAAAFGNGRPVVASRVGGLADAVTDGVDGLLVPPDDAVELAAALARVLTDNDLRARLAEGAQRNAETLYNWREIGDAILDFAKSRVVLNHTGALRRSEKV